MKATVRISAGLTPDTHLQRHLPPEHPPAVGGDSLRRRQWQVSLRTSTHLHIFSIGAVGMGSRVILDITWEVKGDLCIPPGGGPVPVGNSAPTQHNNSSAFLPNIYPGEAPSVAQKSVPICLE